MRWILAFVLVVPLHVCRFVEWQSVAEEEEDTAIVRRAMNCRCIMCNLIFRFSKTCILLAGADARMPDGEWHR